MRNRSFWMGLFGVVVGCLLTAIALTGPLEDVRADSPSTPEARVQFAGTSQPASHAQARTDANRYIPFQAYLTDTEGRPVADTTYRIEFKLYESAEGGEAVWRETHNAVPVAKGMVNVLLGSKNPDNFGDLTFDEAKYVGICVDCTPDSGVELVPRQQIISAIHAADADRAGRLAGSPLGFLTNSVEIVPIGGIISYFGDLSNLPDSWEVCDGRLVDDAESPLNGQPLPNMVGRFARGLDGNMGETVGAQGGEDQHTHSTTSDGTHRHLTPILSTPRDPGEPVHAPTGLWIQPGRFGVSSEAQESAYHVSGGVPFGSSEDPDGTFARWNTTGVEPDHSHTAEMNRNVPSYVALYYIIRIK